MMLTDQMSLTAVPSESDLLDLYAEEILGADVHLPSCFGTFGCAGTASGTFGCFGTFGCGTSKVQ